MKSAESKWFFGFFLMVSSCLLCDVRVASALQFIVRASVYRY